MPFKLELFWIVSIFILGSIILSDIFNHLLYIHYANFWFKSLLLMQLLISINIFILNALLAAGQENGMEILLNAIGLIIINDIDNIIGELFFSFFVVINQFEVSKKETLFLKDYKFSQRVVIGLFLPGTYLLINFIFSFPLEHPTENIIFVELASIFLCIIIMVVCSCIRRHPNRSESIKN